MNRITRTVVQLTVATGIAAAITLTGTAAHADGPSTPGQFTLGPEVDPEGPKLGTPTPEPEPLPAPPAPKGPKAPAKGPGDLTDKPHCTHGCGGSQTPTDTAPAPAPAGEPTGPQEPTDVPEDGLGGADAGCFTGCDLPEEPVVEEESIAIPTRVDAGTDAGTTDAAPAVTAVDDARDVDTAGTVIWAASAAALLALFLLAVAALRRRRAHTA